MVTSYDVLYRGVYAKIKDYDFIQMTEDEANGILFDYIRPAIVKFIDCKQDLKNRNDSEQVFYDILTDETVEILVNYMVIEYINSNYIRVPEALKATMSTNDFHKYDNKDVLAKCIEVKKMYEAENKQLMIDYSYIDSKLFKPNRK